MSAHLPKAISVEAKGGWNETAADSVVLDFAQRHHAFLALTGLRGLAFALDLHEATCLRGGDALRLDDGRLVEVVASPEPLSEIRTSDAHLLVRLAWHLGNRHMPMQIMIKSLRCRPDHAVEELARGLGAKVVAIDAPFDPEGGAYAKPAQVQKPGHVHDHTCNHSSHDHADHHHA